LKFENQVLLSGGNSQALGRLYYSASPSGSGPIQIGSQAGPFSAISSPQSFAFSLSGVPSTSYVAAFFGNNTSPDTNAIDVTYFDDLVYCAYGTQLKPGQQTVLILTEAAIAAATTAFPPLELFAIVWGAFVGWTVTTGPLRDTRGAGPGTAP